MLRHNLCLVKNIRWLILLQICILAIAPNTYAQQVENLYLEPFGDKIIIHYDFVSKNPGDSYQLKVYQSIDGFDKVINLVKGDVGEMVSPGKGKRIEWYAREELGSYKGAIRVELRVYESPEKIYIQYPSATTKVKRGNEVTINWSGGINEDNVSIHLFYNGKQLETIANNIDNSGQYKWVTSKKMKPGKNYTVGISGTSAKDTQSSSGIFVIKRRIPVWLMAVPLAIAGTATVVLINSSKTESGDTNLPAAPDPN